MARGPFHFEFTNRKQRDADLENWVRQYAAQLEELLQKYPLQWHNFYMFWETERGTGW
jgi:predicted LPLAT superfamily acyltransferase